MSFRVGVRFSMTPTGLEQEGQRRPVFAGVVAIQLDY